MHKPVVVASVATWIRATICARASVAAAFRMVEKYDVSFWSPWLTPLRTTPFVGLWVCGFVGLWGCGVVGLWCVCVCFIGRVGPKKLQKSASFANFYQNRTKMGPKSTTNGTNLGQGGGKGQPKIDKNMKKYKKRKRKEAK